MAPHTNAIQKNNNNFEVINWGGGRGGASGGEGGEGGGNTPMTTLCEKKMKEQKAKKWYSLPSATVQRS
jgi:hypothetical protein